MWLNCPGSARLNEMFPDSESPYAQQGTLAHSLAEIKLRKAIGEISPQKYGADLKKIKAEADYDEEMEDHTDDYIGYVMGLPGDEVLVEQSLEFGEYVPEGFGTGDAIKVDNDVLHVVDFKYGKGAKVEAEDNTQLMFYALGAIVALGMVFDFEKVHVHIFQPRLGSPTSAEYTKKEILDWADTIIAPAKKAWDGVEEYHSGPWCRWCKASATCKTSMQEQAKEAFDNAFTEPEEVTGFIPNQMTEDEIVYWLGVKDGIEKFLKDLKSWAEEQAINHGRVFPGFKVVEGRSTRSYSDEPAVIKVLDHLGVEGYLEHKLKGITALTKILGKKEFEKNIGPLLVKPPGKPTLVPESDKREPLNNAKEAFND
jgi:hypothetical protein